MYTVWPKIHLDSQGVLISMVHSRLKGFTVMTLKLLWCLSLFCCLYIEVTEEWPGTAFLYVHLYLNMVLMKQ